MSDIFVYMPADIALDERLTKTHLRVLIALYSFRKKNTDTAWPSRKKLAERCGLLEHKISTATTELVELGWVRKVGNGGRSRACQYELTIPEMFAETVPESGTVPKSETVPKVGTKTVPNSGTKTVPDLGRGKEHANEQANEQAISLAAPKGKTFLSDDFTPNTANELEAKKLGVDLHTELEKFKAYWIADGAAKANWQSAFKGWLLNAHGFAANRARESQQRLAANQTKADKNAAFLHELTGGIHGNQTTGGLSHERTIDSTATHIA